jgi:hypothetical protein
MKPTEIVQQIIKIQDGLEQLHGARPLTPQEKALLLMTLVYLRFRNETIELP